MGKNLGTIFILVLMMYATKRRIVALMSNHRVNQPANSVKAKAEYAKPMPNQTSYDNERKCVETIYGLSHVDNDIVRYSFEKRREQLSCITSWVGNSAPHSRNWMLKNLANSAKTKAKTMLTPNQTYENRKCVEHIYETPHAGDNMCRTSSESGENNGEFHGCHDRTKLSPVGVIL